MQTVSDVGLTHTRVAVLHSLLNTSCSNMQLPVAIATLNEAVV